MALRLVIKNTTGAKTDLSFGSAQTHDFVVKDADNDLVWRWSHDRAFAQIFVKKSLRPGAKMTFVSAWDQTTNKNRPAPAGKYRVEAEFLAIGNFAAVGPLHIEIVK